jgi:hypothetical protein
MEVPAGKRDRAAAGAAEGQDRGIVLCQRRGGLSKSPELISALVSSAFVIKYTLFGSARLPGNGFSIR